MMMIGIEMMIALYTDDDDHHHDDHHIVHNGDDHHHLDIGDDVRIVYALAIIRCDIFW